MDEPIRHKLEDEIRAALAAGDQDRVMKLALRGYGPEVLGFLHGRSGDPALVEDAFSLLCEQLWRSLPGYAGRASFRTWIYMLARTSAAQVLRGEWRRARRSRPLGTHEEIAAEVRTATEPFLRTDVKDRVAALRHQLPPEDRDLLILRVDRQIDWSEIAQILGDRAEWSDADLRREAARLRKRFQLIKERLRELAQREGILPRE